MKIQFNPDLEYQHDAINAVLGVFEGQEARQTNFSVPTIKQAQMDMLSEQSDLGIGNKKELLDDEILVNVQKVQLTNGLKQSDSLGSMDFTVEMETGTGKTYVYLRSIFEMNRRFGFSKFIIVVPSIAIKEGVYKSLQITEEHFKEHYDNVPYDYFIYDSSNLGEVRSFATNDAIQIMVINIDAFRKSFSDPSKETKANIIHRAQDKLSGTKPIEFIRSTNPIVIIDEPQSVDTTSKSKEAIASLNPLCTIRYSATHKDKHNRLYKLDSIDAYDQKLVKQIEVASIQVQDGHNKAYIKLFSVDIKTHTAKIEIDAMQNGQVKRITKKVKSGTDLLDLSGGRDIYDGYVISEIYCEPGMEYIDFTSMPDVIRLNQVIGGVDEDQYKRLQIRKTIEEHLEKELRLRPKGLKVLSLFFIDKVANYRSYDDDGNPQKGKYAQMFEEEYAVLIKKPKYHSLFEGADLESLPEEVHNGYFAIDKKKDSKGNNLLKESKGEAKTAADGSAYNLIMKDKEKLLSFESKLKFIFSHSALKEGWDNPNVFQICTLNETTSVMKKRQEIGRGLRIAVNQDGERVYGFDVNTLTVMANESYENFVKQLQKEIEDDEGIRFGMVEKHMFANIVVENDSHQDEYLGTEASEEIYHHLYEQGYIDNRGKVDDKLKKDLKENQVNLPEEHKEHAAQIVAALKKVAGNLNIKDAGKRENVNLNKSIYLGEEFKALWERIKYKTTFRVDFDVQDLIEKCAKEINENLVVGKTRFVYEKDKVQVLRGGLEGVDSKKNVYVYDVKDFALPDVVSHLQNETNLTRRTIVDILIKSDQLEKFKSNPQKYIDEVAAIIKRQMRHFIVDGIKYEKIGDDHFYAQELFEENELTGYLSKNMLKAKKSVYEQVIYDSDVEQEFAENFEKSDDVKVYAKLPSWFKVDTPLGSYNPDWAVLVHCDGKDKLYFVVETKGSLFTDAFRPAEKDKIKCGEEHFKAIGDDVGFTVANKFDAFMGTVIS
jgi:type III restriction enzyme